MAVLLMADPTVEGLKSASEVAKQIITLSTGVTALSITFWEKVDGLSKTGHSVLFLRVGWGLFIVAILAALATLMAITGTLTILDRKSNGGILSADQQRTIDAYGSNIRLPAGAMVILFVLAMLSTVVSAIIH